jgi:hypothetical protein
MRREHPIGEAGVGRTRRQKNNWQKYEGMVAGPLLGEKGTLILANRH